MVDALLIVLTKLTDILVHNGAAYHLEEVGVKLTSHCPGQKSFTSARRPVQQTALGGDNANSLEQLRVEERQLDHLPQLSDLLAQTSDVGVGHVSRVLVTHVVDQRVNLPGQIPEMNMNIAIGFRKNDTDLIMVSVVMSRATLVPGFSLDFSSCLLQPTT